MIYCASMGKGLLGGAIGALPLPASAVAGVAVEMKKLKGPANLAAMIGYHYNQYPNANAFKTKFPIHATVIFSEVSIPNAGASLAGDGLEEVLTNAGLWGLKTLTKGASAIPGLGNAVGFVVGAISAAIDARKGGNRAANYFSKQK